MADLKRVRVWADALIRMHLDPVVWSFDFDNAKRRAGLCNFTDKKISVSRYLANKWDDDEIHQILLHEVAHAMAGPRAGHGPRWKAVAADLGYVGSRTADGDGVDELAPWVGTCPSGHITYRYRAPKHQVSCGQCARRFDRAFLISWTKREISARDRRQAAARG